MAKKNELRNATKKSKGPASNKNGMHEEATSPVALNTPSAFLVNFLSMMPPRSPMMETPNSPAAYTSDDVTPLESLTK